MNNSPSDRLAFLDVARGLAALLVLAEHGLEVCLPGFKDWSENNIHLGRIGVLVFLAISGFIIPQSLQEGGSNFRFWLRRVFRLFPAYWAIILLGYIYALVDGRGMTVSADETNVWLWNLTMLQGFFEIPHVWGMFWTLQLELVIYAFCSLLLAVGLLKHTRRLLWFGIVVYLGLAYIAPTRFHFALVLYFHLPYAAAMVGYVAHAWLSGKESRTVSLTLLGALILGPLLVQVYNFRHLLREHAVFFLRDYLCHYLVAYAFFFTLAALRHMPMPWIGRRLGHISYSVYLTHALVLRVLYFWGLPLWLMMPALVLVTLALSELMYRFIEEPGISLGRYLERLLMSPRSKPADIPKLPISVQSAA